MEDTNSGSARGRLLPVFSAVFAATLILTNVLNTKVFVLAGFSFPAGIITFPLSFLLADTLTEVYGYAVTRRVIWIGFACLIGMTAVLALVVEIPPAPFWTLQAGFEALFAQVPRIVLASMLAYVSGEFCNSYVLARSKIRTNGRGMAIRFVTSTIAGQAADTLVFMSIAFIGVFPSNEIAKLFVSAWIFKVMWEVVALPLSVPFVRFVKQHEGVDTYDRGTSFTPFRF